MIVSSVLSVNDTYDYRNIRLEIKRYRNGYLSIRGGVGTLGGLGGGCPATIQLQDSQNGFIITHNCTGNRWIWYKAAKAKYEIGS